MQESLVLLMQFFGLNRLPVSGLSIDRTCELNYGFGYRLAIGDKGRGFSLIGSSIKRGGWI